MSEPESMQVTTRIRRYLLEFPEENKLSNRQLAQLFDCDKGTVSRARNPTVAELKAENETLRAEIRQYRHNQPRPKKVKTDETPLFEGGH